eukprot:jgi/Botrbrau1/2368/Bobra.0395s0003.1
MMDDFIPDPNQPAGFPRVEDTGDPLPNLKEDPLPPTGKSESRPEGRSQFPTSPLLHAHHIEDLPPADLAISKPGEVPHGAEESTAQAVLQGRPQAPTAALEKCSSAQGRPQAVGEALRTLASVQGRPQEGDDSPVSTIDLQGRLQFAGDPLLSTADLASPTADPPGSLLLGEVRGDRGGPGPTDGPAVPSACWERELSGHCVWRRMAVAVTDVRCSGGLLPHRYRILMKMSHASGISPLIQREGGAWTGEADLAVPVLPVHMGPCDDGPPAMLLELRGQAPDHEEFLFGLVRVALPSELPPATAVASGPRRLVEGTYDIWDPLAGKACGCVTVEVTDLGVTASQQRHSVLAAPHFQALPARGQAERSTAGGNLPVLPEQELYRALPDQAQQQAQAEHSGRAELAAGLSAQSASAAPVQARNAGQSGSGPDLAREPVLLEHLFEVLLERVVPASLTVSPSLQSAFYVKYTMPGEERPCFTEEAPAGPEGAYFGAAASFALLLSKEEEPLEVLEEEDHEGLLLEVWERRGVLTDRLAGVALLPFSHFFKSPSGDQAPSGDQMLKGSAPGLLASRGLPNSARPWLPEQAGSGPPDYMPVTLQVTVPDQELPENGPWAQGRLELGVRYCCMGLAEEAGGDGPPGGSRRCESAEASGDQGLALIPATCPGKLPVEAMLCVEVHRACGLQAAVEEAATIRTGSALSLARRLGPHAYACVLLGTHGALRERVPPMVSPFQAQTFCPDFGFQEDVALSLDPATLSCIATQALQVELWHHCPRWQAVAAARTAGCGSTEVSCSGSQDTLLGTAMTPMCPLLTSPKGLRGWLQVVSPGGANVGAVEISISFSHLAGAPMEGPTARRCLLELLPVVGDWIPASVPQPSVEGFDGCFGRLEIHVQEIVLPQSSTSPRHRPPIGPVFFGTYRLPGMSPRREIMTCPAAAAVSAGAPGEPNQAWKVVLDHLGCHAVTANGTLWEVLRSQPLTVSLMRRTAPLLDGARPQTLTAGCALLGFAEIDVSPLLYPPRGRPRTVSGSFSMVHPHSRNLGKGAAVVTVSLHLSSEVKPAEVPQQHVPLLNNVPHASHGAPKQDLASWGRGRIKPPYFAKENRAGGVAHGKVPRSIPSTSTAPSNFFPPASTDALAPEGSNSERGPSGRAPLLPRKPDTSFTQNQTSSSRLPAGIEPAELPTTMQPVCSVTPSAVSSGGAAEMKSPSPVHDGSTNGSTSSTSGRAPDIFLDMKERQCTSQVMVDCSTSGTRHSGLGWAPARHDLSPEAYSDASFAEIDLLQEKVVETLFADSDPTPEPCSQIIGHEVSAGGPLAAPHLPPAHVTPSYGSPATPDSRRAPLGDLRGDPVTVPDPPAASRCPAESHGSHGHLLGSHGSHGSPLDAHRSDGPVSDMQLHANTARGDMRGVPRGEEGASLEALWVPQDHVRGIPRGEEGDSLEAAGVPQDHRSEIPQGKEADTLEATGVLEDSHGSHGHPAPLDRSVGLAKHSAHAGPPLTVSETPNPLGDQNPFSAVSAIEGLPIGPSVEESGSVAGCQDPVGAVPNSTALGGAVSGTSVGGSSKGLSVAGARGGLSVAGAEEDCTLTAGEADKPGQRRPGVLIRQPAPPRGTPHMGEESPCDVDGTQARASSFCPVREGILLGHNRVPMSGVAEGGIWSPEGPEVGLGVPGAVPKGYWSPGDPGFEATSSGGSQELEVAVAGGGQYPDGAGPTACDSWYPGEPEPAPGGARYPDTGSTCGAVDLMRLAQVVTLSDDEELIALDGMCTSDESDSEGAEMPVGVVLEDAREGGESVEEQGEVVGIPTEGTELPDPARVPRVPPTQNLPHLPAGFAMHDEDWLFGFSVHHQSNEPVLPNQEASGLGNPLPGADPQVGPPNRSSDGTHPGDRSVESRHVLPDGVPDAYESSNVTGVGSWEPSENIQVSRVCFEGKAPSVTFVNCLPDGDGQFTRMA